MNDFLYVLLFAFIVLSFFIYQYWKGYKALKYKIDTLEDEINDFKRLKEELDNGQNNF